MTQFLKRLLLVLVGAAICLAAQFAVNRFVPHDDDKSVLNLDADKATNADLIALSTSIAEGFYNKDYTYVAKYVHPDYGVIFSPYATVNLNANKRFTSDEVADFINIDDTFIWGANAVTDVPLEYTPDQYVERFVTDMNFSQAPVACVNSVIQSGNALENVTQTFPDSDFVDLMFPDNQATDVNDWYILRLVFEEYNGVLMLTAVIHSDWTV